MLYHEHIPFSKILREFIDCFWTISFPDIENFKAEDLVLPDGGVEWVFTNGDGFRREIVGKPHDVAFITNDTIVGQRSTAIHITQSQKNRLFVIRFKPYGLSYLKFAGAKELTDQVVDANLIFGSLSNQISDTLRAQNTLTESLQQIEALLLKNTVLVPAHPLLHVMWNEIICSKGLVSIHDFCHRHGVHKSTVQRLFMENVGTGPKALANIIRMNHTISDFYSDESLTRIGFDHGYFDQSHMIRDLKKFTGLTPKKFRKSHFVLPTILKTVDRTRQQHYGLADVLVMG